MKKIQEFKREQGGVYGRVCKIKKEWENYVTIV